MTANGLVEVPSDLDEFYDFVQERSWSDGLPVIPPTDARVAAFLASTPRDPDEIVAVLAPASGEATIRAIATNAVMAGCRPEYLPVVIAAVEAIADPAFNLNSVQVDVNAATLAVLVNGPIREAIGMNWGGGALSGRARANATIGRAVRFAMINLGGARSPESDLTIHGQPGCISMCMAEDEDGSPWEPLHVERGFNRADSVVTVAAVTGTQNVLTGIHEPDAMLTLMADSICTMGANTVLLGATGGGPIVSFSRSLADLLARDGLTKADVKRVLYERARKPAAFMPGTKRPDRINQMLIDDGEIRALADEAQPIVFVAGYESPNHTCLMPNYCVSGVVSRQVQFDG